MIEYVAKSLGNGWWGLYRRDANSKSYVYEISRITFTECFTVEDLIETIKRYFTPKEEPTIITKNEVRFLV